MIHFDDGISINTSGPLRMLHLADGWYVVGEGHCIPVADQAEAEQTIAEMVNALKQLSEKTIEIADYCQHPGCNKRTAVWCEGIAACAEHEPWLFQQVQAALERRERDEN